MSKSLKSQNPTHLTRGFMVPEGGEVTRDGPLLAANTNAIDHGLASVFLSIPSEAQPLSKIAMSCYGGIHKPIGDLGIVECRIL
jgi:hypothetical protein